MIAMHGGSAQCEFERGFGVGILCANSGLSSSRDLRGDFVWAFKLGTYNGI